MGLKYSSSLFSIINAERFFSSRKKIYKHAPEKFSLRRNDVTSKEITSKDLPIGVKYFYLEKKRIYGSGFYSYLTHNDKVFCSKIEGDFKNLLKDSDFLSKKNINAN